VNARYDSAEYGPAFVIALDEVLASRKPGRARDLMNRLSKDHTDRHPPALQAARELWRTTGDASLRSHLRSRLVVLEDREVAAEVANQIEDPEARADAAWAMRLTLPRGELEAKLRALLAAHPDDVELWSDVSSGVCVLHDREAVEIIWNLHREAAGPVRDALERQLATWYIWPEILENGDDAVFDAALALYAATRLIQLRNVLADAFAATTASHRIAKLVDGIDNDQFPDYLHGLIVERGAAAIEPALVAIVAGRPALPLADLVNLVTGSEPPDWSALARELLARHESALAEEIDADDVTQLRSRAAAA
jgi:hypothetical protein